MNIEGLTLKLLTDTLNEELLGSKIYKVYMPNPQSLLLLVRRTRDTSSLLADMHNGSGDVGFAGKDSAIAALCCAYMLQGVDDNIVLRKNDITVFTGKLKNQLFGNNFTGGA